MLSTLPPLPPSFYEASTLEVAQKLLGKGLYRHVEGNDLLVLLTEVEVYLGQADPASHAYRGMTLRNQAMFDEAGTCYVYFTYGMHYCMNVVTAKRGVAEAVLLRSALPLKGMEWMACRRKTNDPLKILSGPARLTQALQVTRQDNRKKLNDPHFKLVDLDITVPPTAIDQGPRIGISAAKEEPFRYFIRGCPWLSRVGRAREKHV